MKLKSIALAATLAAAGIATTLSSPALAQAKEQFFPVLVYRTGAYAPNGVPFANGYVDYLKLVNAKGGINGVKVSWEECETGYATDRGVECYERLKGKGATVFQPLSTGITFALTEKVPNDKIPLITAGYGRSESTDGMVFKWNFPLTGTYWDAADIILQHIAKKEGGIGWMIGSALSFALGRHARGWILRRFPSMQRHADIDHLARQPQRRIAADRLRRIDGDERPPVAFRGVRDRQAGQSAKRRGGPPRPKR